MLHSIKKAIGFFLFLLNFFCIICYSAVASNLETMGSLTLQKTTLQTIECENTVTSDSIKLSKTTIKSLATQERSITFTDTSGTVMITGFSSIITSTTLDASNNGIILVSNNITLTLPDPSTCLGTIYTIKKTDSLPNIVTISGTIDNTANPQLTHQFAFMTIVSNGTS